MTFPPKLHHLPYKNYGGGEEIFVAVPWNVSHYINTSTLA